MITKVIWLCQRASVMSFPEYIYRLGHLFRDVVQYFWIKANKKHSLQVLHPSSAELKNSVFSDLSETNILHDLPEEYCKRCICEANAVLHNKFSLFKLENHFVGDSIEWNYDYKNNIHIQLRYAPFLDFRSFNAVGDIKYVFEINKHQGLPRLSQAYILTQDTRYVDKLIYYVDSWIEQNPYMIGVNWASPSVAAYRLVSWSLAFEFLRNHYQFSAEFLQKWAQSVYLHVKFISENYSLYSSAGNHLISEAVGVFVASLRWKIFFGGQEKTFLNAAQEKAYLILAQEIDTQILSDGVNHEQSVSYQVFAANQFFIAYYFGNKSGITFSDNYLDRLRKCGEFVSSLLNVAGNVPNFGDEDGAWAFRLASRNTNKYMDQLGIWSVLFDEPAFASKGMLSETVYWLFASQTEKINRLIQKKLPQLTSENQIDEKYFSKGGYYIATIGRGTQHEVFVFFDCGPLGTCQTGAHGHADALSICLSLGGIQVFVDSGTYTYKNIPERKALRVTSAHNTLNFGKLSCQDKYLGPFLWGARHKTFAHSEGHGRFVGNVKWWSGETHSRELTILENALTINDQWHGKCFPSIVFHINPLLTDSVYRKNSECVYIETKKIKCTLRSVGNRAEIEKTKISPAFHELLESKKIIIRPQQLAGMQKTQISWEFK